MLQMEKLLKGNESLPLLHQCIFSLLAAGLRPDSDLWTEIVHKYLPE